MSSSSKACSRQCTLVDASGKRVRVAGQGQGGEQESRITRTARRADEAMAAWRAEEARIDELEYKKYGPCKKKVNLKKNHKKIKDRTKEIDELNSDKEFEELVELYEGQLESLNDSRREPIRLRSRNDDDSRNEEKHKEKKRKYCVDELKLSSEDGRMSVTRTRLRKLCEES